MILFVCPKCGYADINELSLCVVTNRVSKWSETGEPEDYDAGEVDWESEMPYDTLNLPDHKPKTTFECGRCAAQFETPKPAERAQLPR
ncbi:MAG: hypothetical protein Q7S58_10010 [Candidatus Binatus sp.]|uniref:hypothetical protein n=1 Tax=Candidatus Binatus sp. TaxID=2811406 RepID=UPI002726B1AD|nr:hypothetical protein [Candidatus Binatus sp.]MDO8432727.1 hypothetical protein [Candidatus Binatus sp.]